MVTFKASLPNEAHIYDSSIMKRTNLLTSIKNNIIKYQNNISSKSSITLLGVLLITLGSYLPWLQENPWYEVRGLIRIAPYTASPGIEWIHLILLIPAGIAIATILTRGPTPSWEWASIITGAGAILFPVILVLNHYTNDGFYYIPDGGWFLTVLGGLLLVGIGVTSRR